MRIVININEDTYKNIVKSEYTEHGFVFDDDKEVAIHAIRNGTPLPEHHGDLKDERDVVNILLKYAHSEQGKSFANFLVSEINDAPTIIEGSESE